MEEYEKMGYCPNCRKLKALEIIKPFISLEIYKEDSYVQYILWFNGKDKVLISKEEYDLLKEIFND